MYTAIISVVKTACCVCAMSVVNAADLKGVSLHRYYVSFHCFSALSSLRRI